MATPLARFRICFTAAGRLRNNKDCEIAKLRGMSDLTDQSDKSDERARQWAGRNH